MVIVALVVVKVEVVDTVLADVKMLVDSMEELVVESEAPVEVERETDVVNGCSPLDVETLEIEVKVDVDSALVESDDEMGALVVDETGSLDDDSEAQVIDEGPVVVRPLVGDPVVGVTVDDSRVDEVTASFVKDCVVPEVTLDKPVVVCDTGPPVEALVPDDTVEDAGFVGVTGPTVDDSPVVETVEEKPAEEVVSLLGVVLAVLIVETGAPEVDRGTRVEAVEEVAMALVVMVVQSPQPWGGGIG